MCGADPSPLLEKQEGGRKMLMTFESDGRSTSSTTFRRFSCVILDSVPVREDHASSHDKVSRDKRAEESLVSNHQGVHRVCFKCKGN